MDYENAGTADQQQSELEEVKYNFNYGDNSLESALRRIASEIESEDETVERSRIAKETKAIYFYRGLSNGLEVEGEFIPVNLNGIGSPREQAILLSDNVIRPQVKALAKEWSRSRTALNIKPRKLSWKAKAAARWSDGFIKSAQERIQNEIFRQRESKFAILSGNYFRLSIFEKGGKYSPKIDVPIYETKQVGPGYLECATCLTKESLDDADQLQGVCPECQGDLHQVPPQHGKVQTGTKKVPIGEIQTLHVDPRAVKIPRATKDFKDHSYLRWKEIAELTSAQRRYKHCSITPGIETFDARALIDTESITGSHEYASIYGATRSEETKVELSHYWLTTDRYWMLNFDEDQEIYGFKVKAGIPMDEQYPDGIVFTLNHGRVVRVGAEDFQDYWSHGTFDELFESPYGDGIDDAMADQQRINEITGAQMENVLFQTFGKIIVNPQYLDPSMLDNDSSVVTMRANVATDIEPKQAFAVIDPPRLNEDTWEVRGQVERQMREKTGAYLTLTGQSDPGTGTATETSIMRDQAVAMLGMPLALRSRVDVEWAYQILELIQKNWVPEYHESMLGGYSKHEAQSFKDIDVRSDLRITISNNSWIPRTEDEERNDFVTYITAGNLPLGFANPSVPLPVRKAAAEIFRPGMELDGIQPDIRIAEMRIADLIQASETLPDVSEIDEGTDPAEIEQLHQQLAMSLAGQVPVRLKIDDHATIIGVYQDFMKRDEGIFAHPVVQEAVEVLIERHESALQELAMQAAAMTAATTPQQGSPEGNNKGDTEKQAAAQKASDKKQAQQQVAVSPSMPEAPGNNPDTTAVPM